MQMKYINATYYSLSSARIAEIERCPKVIENLKFCIGSSIEMPS